MKPNVTETFFYFAYGSNADPDRFRARVGSWSSRRPAWLHGYTLRFAENVRSEGGGGAVVDRSESGIVDGVLYEISPEQMAAMDREEFDPERDRDHTARRLSLDVRTSEGSIRAELYAVDDDGGHCPPSETYLGYILTGLADAGHPPEALDRVRRAAGR